MIPMYVYTRSFIQERTTDFLSVHPALEEFMEEYKEIAKDVPIPHFIPRRHHSWRDGSRPVLREQFKSADWMNQKSDKILDKIRMDLLQTINKLSDTNYRMLSQRILKTLHQYSYYEVLEILAETIFDKISYEEQFGYLYTRLLLVLFENSFWQMGSIKVSGGDNKVFLRHINESNIEEEEEIPIGFSTGMKDAQMKAYEIIQFKRYFITYLQEIFNQRNDYYNMYMEEIDDDIHNKIKKKYLGIFLVASNLYVHKMIHINVIHTILLKLMRYNEAAIPNELEMEAIYLIFENLDKIKGKHYLTKAFKKLYFDYIKKTLFDNKSEYSNRIRFRMEDLMELSLSENKDKDVGNKSVKKPVDNKLMRRTNDDINMVNKKSDEEINGDIRSLVSEYLLNQNCDDLELSIKSLASYPTETVLSMVLETFVEENPDVYNLTTHILNRIEERNRINKEDWEKTLKKMSDKLDDFEMDYPNGYKYICDIIKERGFEIIDE